MALSLTTETRHYSVLLFSQISKTVFDMVCVWLLVRILGPSGYGEWAMFSSCAALMHLTFLLWTQPSFVRFGVEEWKLQNSFARIWSDRSPFLVMGIVCCLILVYGDFFGWIEHFFGLSENWRIFIIIYSVGLGLVIETQSVYQIIGAMPRLAAMPMIVSATLTIFYSWLYLWRGHDVKIDHVVSGMISVTAVLWGIALLIEFKRAGVKPQKPSFEGSKRVFLYSWPLIPGYFIDYIFAWGNQLLLQVYYTSSEVGVFQASYQTMIAAMMMLSPFSTILLPKLIGKNVDDPLFSRKFLQDAAPGIMTLWFFVSIPLIAILPYFAMLLMGKRFAGIEMIVAILSLSIPGSVVGRLCDPLFKLQGRFRLLVTMDAFRAVLNVGLALILMPSLGPLGSALAIGLSTVVYYRIILGIQYSFLEAPPDKAKLIFWLMLIFGIGQAFWGENVIARLTFCFGFFLILVLFTRGYALVHSFIIDRIFSGPLASWGTLVKRFLIPAR